MEEDAEHGAVSDPAVAAVDPTGAGVAGTLTATEAEASAAMPQINPDYFDNLIFWLVLALVAIWAIVSRVAMPRIDGTLSARRGAIEGDLAAAERLRADAAAAQTAYDKALADARAEAARIAADTRAQIQAELDAALAEADQRIEARSAESARALSEIEREAAASVDAVARDVARAVVAALGGRVDEGAIDAAVARRMGGMA
jgi:F-type H+-transporting ATPase subunit b